MLPLLRGAMGVCIVTCESVWQSARVFPIQHLVTGFSAEASLFEHWVPPLPPKNKTKRCLQNNGDAPQFRVTRTVSFHPRWWSNRFHADFIHGHSQEIVSAVKALRSPNFSDTQKCPFSVLPELKVCLLPAGFCLSNRSLHPTISPFCVPLCVSARAIPGHLSLGHWTVFQKSIENYFNRLLCFYYLLPTQASALATRQAATALHACK